MLTIKRLRRGMQCISAIHDRAFDKGLISLSNDFTILISDGLKRSADVFVKQVLLPLEGVRLELPERFEPQPEFAAWHRTKIFVDNQTKPVTRT